MSKLVKRILIYGGILAILAVILLPKFDFLQANEKSASSNHRPASTIPVKAKILKPESIDNTIHATGTALASEQVDLNSEVNGRITKINFEEGKPVNKGQLLVKVNDSELQARLEQLQVQKEFLEKQQYRKKKLLEKEGTSEELYEKTVTELKSTEAGIRLVKAQLEKAEIRAPFNGIIGLRKVSPGSYITPQTLIATLYKISPVKIEFTVPGKYTSRIEKNQEIWFKSPRMDTFHKALIYAKQPLLDKDTRTLKFRAKYPNRSQLILPGDFVELRIQLSKIPHVLMLPTEALVTQLKGQKVFLYRNGKAYPKKVKTGIRTNREIRVTEGLSARDTVITSGILKIKPGAKVKITQFN